MLNTHTFFTIWMNFIVQLYYSYLERFALINSSDNLSKYIDKESHYFKTIKKHKVFKKSNLSINTYYWIINNNCSYYYTTTDDEVKTIEHILKVTKISEMCATYVNYYFKFILFSYITGENITLLSELKEKYTVKLSNGVKLYNQAYFLYQEYAKTPDMMIEYEGQLYIIDSYNGLSEEEMKYKINIYSEHFSGACVYIFCYSVSRLDPFSFYCITTDGNLSEVHDIICGPLVLNISEISNNYLLEYSIFTRDIFYWISCAQQGSILKIDESEH